MFAVKGWSVSADKLMLEPPKDSAKPEAQAPKSKKRKRSGASQVVTAANVADLWTKVIDRKETPRQAGQLKHQGDQPKTKADTGSDSKSAGDDGKDDPRPQKKRQKKKQKKQPNNDGEGRPVKAEKAVTEDEEWDGLDDAPKEPSAAPASVEGAAHVTKGQDKPVSGKDASIGVQNDVRSKKDKKKGNPAQFPGMAKPGQTQPGAPLPSAPAVKLTPLQASMREKLVSARFRHLNETLYTKPSVEAFALFKDVPEMFAQYHEGFRRQVEVWPENPVNSYITEIKTRAKVRLHGRPNSVQPGPKAPLPRRDGTCTIADLGCGDAALAAAIQPLARKLHVEVKSFDLQSPSPLVTRADIANLPLANGTVDVAIFCLALMGTNWVDFIEEAYRILRWKGELWVSEIKSRFAMPGAKKRSVVNHSVGNRRKGAADAKKGAKKKGGDHAEEAADDADLVVEIDGADEQRKETDVSAFLEVLKKRGFALRGDPEEAVDLSNKMFVKMSFVKAAPAVKGKCASQAADPRSNGKMKKSFLGDEDDEDGDNEASVLKPCVYKLR